MAATAWHSFVWESGIMWILYDREADHMAEVSEYEASHTYVSLTDPSLFPAEAVLDIDCDAGDSSLQQGGQDSDLETPYS